jgi:hypothetical protein
MPADIVTRNPPSIPNNPLEDAGSRLVKGEARPNRPPIVPLPSPPRLVAGRASGYNGNLGGPMDVLGITGTRTGPAGGPAVLATSKD